MSIPDFPEPSMSAAPKLQTQTQNQHLPMTDTAAAKAYVESHGYDAPLLIVERRRLINAAREFRKAMPRVQPHYAVKANPDRQILGTLYDSGCGFEFASRAELDVLLDLGLNPASVFFSNPIKSVEHIRYASDKGVRWFVIDSVEELDKVHTINQNAKFYLRLKVSNRSALWPLYGKFGASDEEANQILEHASNLGAEINGVTFHVGSQCLDPNSWAKGIEQALAIVEQMKQRGMSFELLNLGGGFPITITGEEPSIQAIATATNAALQQIPESVKIIAEPGRFLCAEAACLVTRVVGAAVRGNQRWLYLENGVYNGLSELAEDFSYCLDIPEASGRQVEWTIAGPTCDSIDVMKQKQQLPVDIPADALVYIPNAGAYSTATACRFNGFEIPRLVLV